MKGQPRFGIGHLKIVDHLILGVADHLLAEKKATLDLSTLDTLACNSWGQMCDLLIRGTINGAFMTIPAAMDLFAKGLNIRLLMFTHRGGSIIVKKNTHRIKQLKDFTHRSVLVPDNLSVQHMLLHRLLSSAGLSLGSHSDTCSDVFTEFTSPYLMPQMLESDTDNDIAGFAVSEPYGSVSIVDDTAVSVCPTTKLWENHPCCAFILQNECIEQYPEAVRELTTVFSKAGQQIEDEKDDMLVSAGQAFLDQPIPILRKIVSICDVNFSPELLIPDPEPVRTIQDYMADAMNIIDRKIDIDQFIDTSFISARGLETGLEN